MSMNLHDVKNVEIVENHYNDGGYTGPSIILHYENRTREYYPSTLFRLPSVEFEEFIKKYPHVIPVLLFDNTKLYVYNKVYLYNWAKMAKDYFTRYTSQDLIKYICEGCVSQIVGMDDDFLEFLMKDSILFEKEFKIELLEHALLITKDNYFCNSAIMNRRVVHKYLESLDGKIRIKDEKELKYRKTLDESLECLPKEVSNLVYYYCE